MNKQQIENWLITRKGYLKKSPIEVAKMLWKLGEFKVKNEKGLKKELEVIKQVQTDLRKATELQENNLLNLYNQIAEKQKNPRLLYIDIETSPNLVFSWNVGRKISLTPDNIVSERAIICICYKWNDEKEVKSLKWDKGNDEKMLKEFAKILNSADVVVHHNGDRYDIPWIRTRCLLFGIELKPKFNSIDTLKYARNSFRLNSNRLDYISKFLGHTGKKETGFDLWKQIVLNNDKKAMETMIDYCKNDILILQEVYERIKNFVPVKKFKFV